MAKIYISKDGKLSALKNKKVAIIGYGSQGHAQAQNLKESGIDVIVGLRKGSDNRKLAKKHKITVMEVSKACEVADVIQLLVPDELMATIYENEVQEHLTKGKTLMFSHGFNIHYKIIKPPAGIDVIMVAPKSPGHLVRSEFEKGGGVPCLFAIHKDATKKAQVTALAYTRAIGGLKAGTYKTTFKAETETDLFGEQSVLCGGASALVKAGFETLTEAGYPKELAYFECMHELKLIVDLFYQGGMSYMWHSVSNTAEYGGLTRGSRVIKAEVKKEMKQILNEIQSGEFANEFLKELKNGGKKYAKLAKAEADHPIETIGKQLRKNMTWIDAK